MKYLIILILLLWSSTYVINATYKQQNKIQQSKLDTLNNHQKLVDSEDGVNLYWNHSRKMHILHNTNDTTVSVKLSGITKNTKKVFTYPRVGGNSRSPIIGYTSLQTLSVD